MQTITYTPAIIAKKNKRIATLTATHEKDVLRIRKVIAKYLNKCADYKNLEDSIFKRANLGGHK